MNAFDADIARLRAKYPPFHARRGPAPQPSCRRKSAFDPIPLTPVLMGVLDELCRARGLRVDELIGPDRSRRVVTVRDEAMALVWARRNYEGRRLYSFTRIGRFFGGRDHSSVSAAIRRYGARLSP